MSIGYPVARPDLDNRMGQLVVDLRNNFIAIQQFKTSLLDDVTILPDAVLSNLAYSPAEITSIRAGFTSLNNLYLISKGTLTQPGINDFWFDVKHFAGLNLK